MRTHLYISDLIEVSQKNMQSLRQLSPQMIEIASSYDVSTTITKDNGSCLVLFTYNSPKILEIDEMNSLDKQFGSATTDLKLLLKDQKIPILN